MNETLKIIKNIIQHQTVQLIGAIVVISLTIINAYTASKLAPLAAGQLSLQQQVSANELRLDADEKFIPEFIVVQEKVIAQKEQLNRIEDKIDNIDNFLRGYK